MKTNKFALLVKRIADVFLSFIGLMVLLPLLAVVALIVRFKLGSPVLFRQVRPGIDCKPFAMYKFRTMTNKCDEQGNLLLDAERLTELGKFLRRTSIDELPELLNVCKGDMSLVGPRPLLMRYLPYYKENEKVRHSVRPGITGLAQISGRNHLCWDDRLEADIRYIEQWSLLMDIKILFKTFISVVNREGVVDAPDTIMLNLDEERTIKEVNS